MGLQETKQKLLHQHRRDKRVEEDRQDGGKKVWVLAAGVALPLQQLKPVKTGRRRHGGDAAAAAVEVLKEAEEEGEEEEPVTPRGEGCRIPAEATTCPPAPKKPRTAVAVRSRRCNRDGEVLEFFRVPADLEAVFVRRAAKAN
ncbi:hypothetical protein ACP70R_029547 [Stipagrostis hirtigluma subsp. patula]